MHKAHAMDRLHGKDDLGNVERRHLLGHVLVKLGDEREQIASGVKLHHEVEKHVVLEAVVESREELALGLQQDRSLLLETSRLPPKKKKTNKQRIRNQ